MKLKLGKFAVPGSVACAVAFAVFSMAGCVSFNQAGHREIAQPDPSKQYHVEMSNFVGEPKIYTGYLEEEETVQTALEKSGAIRKYRHMEIAVMRLVPETGQPLRMVVQYSPRTKRVVDSENYAILPGDRIVIEPASPSFIDRMMGN